MARVDMRRLGLREQGARACGGGAQRAGARSEQRRMKVRGGDGRYNDLGSGGEQTAARRCEACDGQARRNIFLRGMGETYRGGDRHVGPVACAGYNFFTIGKKNTTDMCVGCINTVGVPLWASTEAY